MRQYAQSIDNSTARANPITLFTPYFDVKESALSANSMKNKNVIIFIKTEYVKNHICLISPLITYYTKTQSTQLFTSHDTIA